MSKVPIDTLPVELRIKIYELGDISSITEKLHRNDHEYEYRKYDGYAGGKYESVDFPWYRTILLSGILNDKDAIEIAAIQGEKPRKIMCNYIALSGNLPMMKWARSGKYRGEVDAADEEPPMKQIRVTRSMTREQIRVVQEKIRVAQFPWDEWTCCNAAKFGHFNLLKWLHEQGCPWDSRTFEFAAGFGNVEMLKWLYQEKCPWESWECSKAAEAGHLDVLKWLRERKLIYLDASTFSSAVRSGNLEMVAWLYEQKCPWEKYQLSIAAAEKGGLTMYKWLIEHECGLMNEGTCRVAALNGQLETLKWLHEQGCPWDRDWCSSAAKGGHLETLKWLHDQGCPWNERSCGLAASNGHLDALMWLRENGCPWNGRTLHYARKSGNTAVVEWAKLNGAEEPTEDDFFDDYETDDSDYEEWTELAKAIWSDDITKVKKLIEQGAPLEEIVLRDIFDIKRKCSALGWAIASWTSPQLISVLLAAGASADTQIYTDGEYETLLEWIYGWENRIANEEFYRGAQEEYWGRMPTDEWFATVERILYGVHGTV